MTCVSWDGVDPAIKQKAHDLLTSEAANGIIESSVSNPRIIESVNRSRFITIARRIIAHALSSLQEPLETSPKEGQAILKAFERACSGLRETMENEHFCHLLWLGVDIQVGQDLEQYAEHLEDLQTAQTNLLELTISLGSVAGRGVSKLEPDKGTHRSRGFNLKVRAEVSGLLAWLYRDTFNIAPTFSNAPNIDSAPGTFFCFMESFFKLIDPRWNNTGAHKVIRKSIQSLESEDIQLDFLKG